MKNKQKAVLAMILSALAFSLMGVFIKLVGDIHTPQKVLFRSATIMVCSFMLMKHNKIRLREIKHIKLLTFRSILGTFGILLNYYAIDHLILSDATVLFRLSTIFLLITSYIFLGEKLHLNQLLSILVAFTGVLFVVKPQFDFDLVPYLVAILGALMAAFAYTTLRILGQREKPVSVVFFFSAFTTVVMIPYILFTYEPMTGLQMLYAVLAGVGAYVGQLGVTVAYKYAPAKEVSIYNYLGVVFSAILGILLFGTSPDLMSLIGYGVIFASSYYLYKYNQKAHS